LYNGKPVTGGTITFFPADGTKRPELAQIDENGNYWADLPVGEVKIGVDNRELQAVTQRAGGGAPLPPGVAAKLGAAPRRAGEAKGNLDAAERSPGKHVAIPTRYYDHRNSGLSYTVRPGSQPFDIDLK
jgi:hypothetical protein